MTDTVKKSEYFCPICGKQELIEPTDCGDYYVGPAYVCGNCGSRSYLEGTVDERVKTK